MHGQRVSSEHHSHVYQIMQLASAPVYSLILLLVIRSGYLLTL